MLCMFTADAPPDVIPSPGIKAAAGVPAKPKADVTAAALKSVAKWKRQAVKHVQEDEDAELHKELSALRVTSETEANDPCRRFAEHHLGDGLNGIT